ncbi:bifunctional hydroxymethylpyrimidine kinase/phosphomethylpyrimidine kinase [Brucepastera parasyntrophica]|uniref:bifunctional hydroxymethylpyrimidine kinase/phosphomethylpyrimidine kinase n=1 Tax=Brucepastera parasyntrophica TaxID=2880008 RepID=UPI00210B990D|nr:bifunctional hydroxymethylpyrimidine kinase/phosphomethylpyrimidine kinase [Brucepastera parasyntrophica]ULQ59065.1 bifunctional hydroxymethylpyrimidine kinase/phosphomethylpyrimidine kinase [Brucepastera parasyntrophica]
MIKVVTIAGSDASGGAGLEADLKTFEEYSVYGMAAVTVIATMDPDNCWHHEVFPIEEKALRAQLQTIFKGVGVSAAKTGMLGTPYAVNLAAEYIKEYKIDRYVLDPVMVCKGNDEALNPELNNLVAEKLLPLSLVVTPNLFEAGQLAEMKTPATIEEMKTAAKRIHERGGRNIFVKGGSKLEGQTSAVDIFYNGKEFLQVESALIDTTWIHGSGCTTAAAITAGLAFDLEPYEAVSRAKKFITLSLRNSFELNQWVGPGNPAAWRKGFN